MPVLSTTRRHTRPSSSLQSAPTIMITPVSQTPKIVIPRIGSLPIGIYKSIIQSAEYVVKDDKITAVDFVHELIDAAGNIYNVRFRYFHPKDIDNLMPILVGYGLKCELIQIVGLAEDVEVAPKENSEYLEIKHRNLSKSGSSAKTTVQSQSMAELKDEDVDGEEDEDEYDFTFDDYDEED